MSIEKITAKIIDDAKEQAESELTEARLKAENLVAQAEKEAEKMEVDLLEKGRLEKEKLIGRRKSVAEIDGRKIILAEKQKLISKAFDMAGDRIVSMDRVEYVDMLYKKVLEADVIGCEIVLNEKDRDEIGNTLVSKVNEKLGHEAVRLADETRKIKGGFLLKQGNIYINSSIDNMLNDIKNELLSEVAAMLFK